MSLIGFQFSNYGYPTPTDSDIAAWGKLTGQAGQLASTYVQMGLFGYDLTGFVDDCSSSQIDIRICEILDQSGFDGWSLGVLGVVDATNYDNRYFYGVGVTDTWAGLLFPTYSSYVSEIGYAGPFYYYTDFSASEPSQNSVIYCYSCMETYYGASANGMFSSYDMGYYANGAY